MDFVAEPAVVKNRLGRAGGRAMWRDPWLCSSGVPIVCLPILTRSSALLALLLDDGAVDLEMVSSVLALDPGLAFGTLQMANPEDQQNSGTTWQFPLAVVATGRDRLQELVNCAPKLESGFACATAAKLRQVVLRSVQRACVADFLTRTLGGANPRQSYLAGLLFELPGLVGLIRRKNVTLAQLALQSALRYSLPADVVSALGGPATASNGHARNPICASVRIANLILENNHEADS